MNEFATNRRRWRDLSTKRLLLGLAAAPLAPFLPGAALILLFDSGPMYLPVVGSILVAAELWSLVGGSAYVFLVGRWRGAIRRAECFLLGIVLAATLPFAAEFASIAVDRVIGNPDPGDAFADDFEGPSDFEFAMVVSVLLVPFGALGGFVFWRVGVRPAQPKLADVAPVFD